MYAHCAFYVIHMHAAQATPTAISQTACGTCRLWLEFLQLVGKHQHTDAVHMRCICLFACAYVHVCVCALIHTLVHICGQCYRYNRLRLMHFEGAVLHSMWRVMQTIFSETKYKEL